MAQEDIGLGDLILEIKSYMRKIGVRKAILFGSRARGEHLLNSDVDLIVISNKFAKQSWPERLQFLHKHWELPFYLEGIAYTPYEIRRRRDFSGLVHEALENGIRIWV